MMRACVLLAIAAIAAGLAACSEIEPSFEQRVTQVLTPPRASRFIDTGTAFFITSDGVLLTAAHVVRQCLRIDIVSEAMAPATVSLIDTNHDQDLALLRLDTAASVPAVLEIAAAPPQRSEPAKAYGYPAGGDLLRASVSDAILANDRVPAKFKTYASDPTLLAWFDGAVQHGYSGGPVIDKNGRVIGVSVRKANDPALRLFVATGARSIAKLTSKLELKPSLAASRLVTGDNGDAVRPAIVHVVCWSEVPRPYGGD